MIITAFGSATIISLLLLINAHYFDSTAVAQRTTPRSNETQSLDEESSSATSESQNLNSEVTNTPTGTSQISSKQATIRIIPIDLIPHSPYLCE